MTVIIVTVISFIPVTPPKAFVLVDQISDAMR